MESSEQTGACIYPPICTIKLLFDKGAFFILFFLMLTKSHFFSSLGAYRRDTNLRDSLVSSNLQSGANTEDEPNGTFPCRRPRCKTCAHTNPASQINTPGGPLTIRQRFSCTTSNLVYIITFRACHSVVRWRNRT